MIFVAGTAARGKSINGWVFFISTTGFAGGSGKTVIRAVSFFGECVVIGAGAAAVAARTGDGGSGVGGGLEGGRLGKWIRTVSPERVGAADCGLLSDGETLIRTVSFLGSIASAIHDRTVQYRLCLTGVILSLPK